MTEFHGGRLPEDKSKPRLKLADILSPTAQYPNSKDWYSKVNDWPMYLNDQMGDCTFAAAGHIIEQTTTYGQGKTIEVTDNDVLKGYEVVGGYRPNDPKTDTGAVVQDVLNYWRKTGIGGHKILGFARVSEKNLDEVRTAINLFGTVYLGINFPNTAMTQFDNGEAWDVVPGSFIEGGHAIPSVYYDVALGLYRVVTWGKVQDMTQAFWDKYVEEAWVVISPEWLDVNESNPDGIKVDVLSAQFTDITGEPSPFPKVPTPAPTPVPAPVPVTNPDKVLEDYLRGWLSVHRHFYPVLHQHLRDWLASRS